MAQATGTFDSYDAVGQREDLSDVISNISPEERPFYSNISKRKVKAKKHEWQTDALAAASLTNAQLEGDEFSYADAVATVRVGNYTQIFRKSTQVSNTIEAVDKAGRDSEMEYQVAMRGKELMNDIEATFLNNQASVAGSATVARKLGGLPAWITSNDSRGVNGVQGGFNAGTGIVDAATDGDQRAFTEALLKTVAALVFASGATPKTLMVGAFNKRAFSAFAGIAALRTNMSGTTRDQAHILGAADYYISDWGTLDVVPNRFMRDREAILVDYDYAQAGVLRPIKSIKPAITGDSDRRVLITEQTLIVKNEKAFGIVADLTTS